MLGSFIIYHVRRNYQYGLRLDAVASIARFEHEIQKSEVVCKRTRVRCIQSAWHTNVPDPPADVVCCCQLNIKTLFFICFLLVRISLILEVVSFGRICFFAALSLLGSNELLAVPTKEGGNKGIKFKKGVWNCCNETSKHERIWLIFLYKHRNFFEEDFWNTQIWVISKVNRTPRSTICEWSIQCLLLKHIIDYIISLAVTFVASNIHLKLSLFYKNGPV